MVSFVICCAMVRKGCVARRGGPLLGHCWATYTRARPCSERARFGSLWSHTVRCQSFRNPTLVAKISWTLTLILATHGWHQRGRAKRSAEGRRRDAASGREAMLPSHRARVADLVAGRLRLGDDFGAQVIHTLLTDRIAHDSLVERSMERSNHRNSASSDGSREISRV